MKLDDFLGCFFPDEDETVYLRGFPAKGRTGRVYTKETTRRTLRENKLLQNNLIETNKELGLYFIVNSGGFEKGDITRFNAAFCEIDTIPIPEQHDLYDNCPLPPSIRLETKKSIHAYWLPSETWTREQWLSLHGGLIEFFKSDAGIKNENRLMRLPFFNHLSWNGSALEYKRVVVHTFRPDVRFTYAEMHEAFPFVRAETPKFDGGYNNETLEGIQQELRYRISQLPSYRIEHDKVHASAQGVCHQGESKSAIMVNLRTGEVYCHAGCGYWKIAAAFGLGRPVKDIGPRFVTRRKQATETGRYLEEYVRMGIQG